MFITFTPTLSAICPDALPEVTAVPFTVILAVGEVAVGITVICVVALGTASVYESVLVEKAGDRVPVLAVNADRVGAARLAVKRPRPWVAAASV